MQLNLLSSLSILFAAQLAAGAAIDSEILNRAAQKGGGYAQSCVDTYVTYEGTVNAAYYLNARCNDGKGGNGLTSLRLGDCLGNSNGNLVYNPGGAFGNSCDQVSLGGTVLHARCHINADSTKQTQINLNGVIANVNGQLRC